MLNCSLQVAVERPETIQYYNNFVPEFRGRLMPIGAVFSREGVALGVSRPRDRVHPVYRLLSLSVAGLVASESWMDAARLKWFGPEPDIADSDAPSLRAKLKAQAVEQVLWAAVQTMIAFACAWIAIAVLATIARVPRHAVRNEMCAAVRTLLGVREEEVLGGRPGTLGYRALKTVVLAGLLRLLREDADAATRRCSPDQVEAAIADAAGQERAPPRRLLGTRAPPRDPGPQGTAAAALAEAGVVWIRVAALLDRVAAELAARRPCATWWERALGVDYVRHGRAYARAGFMRSYISAERVLDEWHAGVEEAGLELTVDDAADVVMELIVREERGVLMEGGPVFPYRDGGGSRFGEEERSFDQLTRETRELHARILHVDTAAAAAAAAAEEALSAVSRGETEGMAAERVASPHQHVQRSLSPEGRVSGSVSFRHRFEWAPPQS